MPDQGMKEGLDVSNFSCLDCAQTKNKVLPGRYSQRKTKLLFSDRRLKSGLSSRTPLNGLKSYVPGVASSLNVA